MGRTLWLNRQGAFGEARRALLSVAERVSDYAGRDPVLRGIVADLRDQAEEWSVYQDERRRKVAYSASYNSLKERTWDGQAIRRR